jgi:hypothetical protein
MKFPDLSIDIETLGTRYNAPVMSIGACAFDRDSGRLGKSMHLTIDFRSAIKAGVPDGDTIGWWLNQSAAARKVFDLSDAAQQARVPLATALHALNNFCTQELIGDFRPWGNGATFDITILEHAYDVGAIGLTPPWGTSKFGFTRIRDLRTLVDAAEVLVGFDKKAIAQVGVGHNAVDDAIYQANVCSAAWAALRDGARITKPSNPPVKTPAPWEDEEL